MINESRRQVKRFLSRIAVAASGLAPFASLCVLLPVVHARTVAARAGRALLVGSPILLVGLIQLLMGDLADAALIGGLGLTIVLLGLFAFCEIRDVFAGSVIGLSGLVILAAVIYYADTYRWHSGGPSEVALALSVLQGNEVLTGRSNLGLAGYRGWEVASSDLPLTLTVDLATDSRFSQAAWLGANGGQPAWKEVGAGSIPPVVQMEFERADQFLYRSVFLPNELGPDLLRAQVDLRSANSESLCGHIALGRHEAGAFSHSDYCIDQDWTRTTVEYLPSASSGSKQFDLVVGGFSGPIQARNPKLFKVDSGKQEDVGPMMPTGATLQLSWASRFPWVRSNSRELLVTATPNLEGLSLRAELPNALPVGTRLWTSIILEPGGSARVVGLEWAGGEVHPTPNISRLAMWYSHPNLLGHSLAALGIMGVLTAPSVFLTAVPLALAGALVLLTGSRTALATLLLVSVAWVAARFLSKRRSRLSMVPRKWRAFLLLCSLVLIGAGLYLVGADVRWSPVDVGANAATSGGDRLAIWQFALGQIIHAPLVGQGMAFASAWVQAHPGDTPIFHAHNGLLDLGVRAGLLGILAGVTTVVFLVTSSLVDRSRALFGLLALLMLNLLDSTYMVPTVISPIAFAAFSRPRENYPMSKAQDAS